MIRAFVGATAALLGLLVFTASAEAAPRVFTQPPCISAHNQKCKSFAYFAHDPVIRVFTFTAPKAGVAEVTFNGTLLCTSSSPADAVIDLAAQIVTSLAVAAEINAPGGLHHAAVLPAVISTTTQTPTVEFNLASTRTISYPSGGKKNLYLRITKLRMDQSTACDVYNPMFTVLYLS